jgi:hypothetical protein
MSERQSDERRRFLEIKRQLDAAINEESKASSKMRVENLRRQRTEAINQMEAARQKGDYKTAKYFEYVVQQCSIALNDLY